jgi:hypothetical protein
MIDLLFLEMKLKNVAKSIHFLMYLIIVDFNQKGP